MQAFSIDLFPRFEPEDRKSDIPKADIAKLSYYLDCISACIPGAIDPALTQYECHKSFSQETKDIIINLCSILKPSLLENRAIKLVRKEDLNAIKLNANVAWITLTEKTNLTFVDMEKNNVTGINMNNTEITRMMIYHEKWLKTYYQTPLENLLPAPINFKEEQIDPLPNPIECYLLGEGPKKKVKSHYLLYMAVFGLVSIFGVLGLFYTLFSQRKKFPNNKRLCCVVVPGLLINAGLIFLLIYYGIVDPELDAKNKIIQ